MVFLRVQGRGPPAGREKDRGKLPDVLVDPLNGQISAIEEAGRTP